MLALCLRHFLGRVRCKRDRVSAHGINIHLKISMLVFLLHWCFCIDETLGDHFWWYVSFSLLHITVKANDVPFAS